MHATKSMIAWIIVASLSGCVSIADINAAMGRIDREWQLEYQRSGEELRYRVVEAPATTVVKAMRQTFLDLGMPIQSFSVTEAFVLAESAAPTPLSAEEWKEIVRVDGPRAKEIGGWFMKLEDDPKNYIVRVRATAKESQGGITVVVLEYQLDNPSFRARGIQPARQVPPAAVRLASVKFWIRLEQRLSEAQVPAPRSRREDERRA